MLNYRMKPCPECGQLHDKRAKYCRRCAGISRRIRPDELRTKRQAYENQYYAQKGKLGICLDCGTAITNNSKRCSLCHSKYIGSKNSGSNHWNWKGGIRQRAGYVFIYSPQHPRADQRNKTVPEHILIWEETHGKPLPDGWKVHHLNGIKDDNRPKNLVGMPSKKHDRLISEKEKRIQELEALLNNQGQLL